MTPCWMSTSLRAERSGLRETKPMLRNGLISAAVMVLFGCADGQAHQKGLLSSSTAARGRRRQPLVSVTLVQPSSWERRQPNSCAVDGTFDQQLYSSTEISIGLAMKARGETIVKMVPFRSDGDQRWRSLAPIDLKPDEIAIGYDARERRGVLWIVREDGDDWYCVTVAKREGLIEVALDLFERGAF